MEEKTAYMTCLLSLPAWQLYSVVPGTQGCHAKQS